MYPHHKALYVPNHGLHLPLNSTHYAQYMSAYKTGCDGVYMTFTTKDVWHTAQRGWELGNKKYQLKQLITGVPTITEILQDIAIQDQINQQRGK